MNVRSTFIIVITETMRGKGRSFELDKQNSKGVMYSAGRHVYSLCSGSFGTIFGFLVNMHRL